ncbi:hypothetical protein MAPG_11470 [Magnaporthiopsis poae ATCC 64411]|uniref:Tat pathway signal sequence domain protein n=1 Tax=Magnaporthiopsis poae (strain ATCC 64411 / 73-15) TaxID=644358 RepID=A0A0C4EFC7_MAGP6|nr:hypothetical protein MAPG_11470 [Magnaporthiopsis poae ATCC 64411]
MISRAALCLTAVAGLLASAQVANTTTESVKVGWLGGTAPAHHSGVTFGLPWSRGKHQPGETRFTTSDGGDIQSWVTAYWPDGSIKWTGHAVPAAQKPASEYTIVATTVPVMSPPANSTKRDLDGNSKSRLVKSNSESEVIVDTGKISVTFAKQGGILVKSIAAAGGKIVGQNGRLVLHSQSGVAHEAAGSGGPAIELYSFDSSIDNVTVSEQSSVRALVTVRGRHQQAASSSSTAHGAWLPFVLRFYLYAGAESLRIVHSIVYDGDAQRDSIAGVGIRFDVPLAGEQLYDRHVRRAPRVYSRILTWDTRVTSRLHWVPSFGDFSLTQLTPDGFSIKKRTKAGQAWVHSTGGTRSGGIAYLGGATKGGLAVGLRHFWKRHPTGLDIRNAANDTGELTLWIYSPEAQPLDLRPFHDGLGQKTYKDQLDALEITYEDWEEGFDTPYGIARTNEVFVFPFGQTPSRQFLSELADHIENPPVLTASPETYHASGAVGTYWSLPDKTASPTAAAIERNLDILFKLYEGQVEQRRWYGFLDHGDFMHTYDVDRHTWRYDVGGYGWDNSELSPDLFFWQLFLRTGRADVYRFAEAQTRHTGEVDVYHVGKWKGLGTRHGVQHWSDSAKQARISTPQYRKYFYFVSGGDERVGELMEETLDADTTFGFLDARRKVRNDGFKPSPVAADIGLGTDWGALAAGWLIEVERRGRRYNEALDKLTRTMAGIAKLKNGFVTGSATYNTLTGDLGPPPGDESNGGVVGISHLSAMFGLVEVVHEITEHFGGGDALPAGFDAAWLDYCVYYGASGAQQAARYGAAFSGVSLRQGHSRLTAYAAKRLGREGNGTALAKRAWDEFLRKDGLTPGLPWATNKVNKTDFVGPADEAPWMSSNDLGLYGCAAIENLQLVPEAIDL